MPIYVLHITALIQHIINGIKLMHKHIKRHLHMHGLILRLV